MSRIYNFSAGPSMLPEVVLKKAAEEMMDYNGSGMSVMEMSHRSPVYDKIIKDAEASLRKLMSIPDNYKVLFVQGGATLQFSAVPLNLMKSGKADYIVSGQFSGKAAKEAERYGKVNVVASTKDKNFTAVPVVAKEDFDPEADYVHICFNNTIYGTVYNYIPETGDVPLVADMSSCILPHLSTLASSALSTQARRRTWHLQVLPLLSSERTFWATQDTNVPFIWIIKLRLITTLCITLLPATPSMPQVLFTNGFWVLAVLRLWSR